RPAIGRVELPRPPSARLQPGFGRVRLQCRPDSLLRSLWHGLPRSRPLGPLVRLLGGPWHNPQHDLFFVLPAAPGWPVLPDAECLPASDPDLALPRPRYEADRRRPFPSGATTNGQPEWINRTASDQTYSSPPPWVRLN